MVSMVNIIRHNYHSGDYSFIKLAWWCIALPIINFFVLFAYYGAGLFTQIFSGTEGKRKEFENEKGISRIMRKAAMQSATLTKVDTILDEYLGDVFSYVNSAGNAFHREEKEPAIPPQIKSVYSHIMDRFYDQLSRAQADGCATIQIVAHSLGTVVTYHALSGFQIESSGSEDLENIRKALAKVSHIYTLGCPLEKIRFFWPRLTSGAPFSSMTVRWANFVSWFDFVSGKLKRFECWGNIENIHLLAAAFSGGTSYTSAAQLFWMLSPGVYADTAFSGSASLERGFVIGCFFLVRRCLRRQ